ncbi:CCR4-NOT transcription complex subunit 1 [Coelomomyces lativittatus]|nr:CCR4-NOT transcription complex subunit 1 [Coelomomyces lativittatus]
MDLIKDVQLVPTIQTEGFIQLLQTANIQLHLWDAASIAAKFKFVNNKRDEVTSSVYNVHLINAVVFMAGINDPDFQRLTFYHHLLMYLNAEGRYHVLSALVNHLRYPNAHTKYFASILLNLFQQKEPSDTSLQEQITRVLLERLIVNRPHPWGLLVTFIELIKDPQYGFWNYGFTRCAPDIERLFESVSRSVNQH